MNRLNLVATYVFEEMTADGVDVAKDFWKYLRDRMMGGVDQKVRVSEYVYDWVLRRDTESFDTKYPGSDLVNIKKTKSQMEFLCSAVSILLHYSDAGRRMLDWS